MELIKALEWKLNKLLQELFTPVEMRDALLEISIAVVWMWHDSFYI